MSPVQVRGCHATEIRRIVAREHVNARLSVIFVRFLPEDSALPMIRSANKSGAAIVTLAGSVS
jgi:hypothetical protein